MNMSGDIEAHKKWLKTSLGAFAFLCSTVTPPLAENNEFSRPDSTRQFMSPRANQGGEFSAAPTITGELFEKTVSKVEADLQRKNAMAAATLLDTIKFEKLEQPYETDRFLVLMQKAADALQSHGQEFPDNASLKKSEDFTTKMLIWIDKSRQPKLLAHAQGTLGKALVSQGARLGDHALLKKGIATLRTASEAWTLEKDPEFWAQAQLDLGEALVANARLTIGNTDFQDAIVLYQKVIEHRGQERIRGFAVKAQSMLANALWSFGSRQNDATLYHQAIDAAVQALDQLDKNVHPLEWATTKLYLANATRDYASLTGDSELLTKALDYYNQSLSVRTRDRYPIYWAQTQLDYGNALAHYWYGATSNDVDANPAVQAYKASLEIRTQTDTPLDWAMSQNNLAVTIMPMLVRDDNPDPKMYMAAIDQLRSAAEVTTRERSPVDWAMIKNNLTGNLINYFNDTRRARQEMLQREMDEAMRAQVEYPLEKSVEMHQAAMAKILAKADSVAELDEALAHSNDVLEFYTKEKFPWYWLFYSRNQASALENLGIQKNSPHYLQKAVAIFREQQTLIQRQYDEIGWGKIEYRIAELNSMIGKINNDARKLLDSEDAYENALETIPGEMQSRLAEVKRELADTKCYRGKLTFDNNATEGGVSIYKSLIEDGTSNAEGNEIYFLQQAIDRCREIGPKTRK